MYNPNVAGSGEANYHFKQVLSGAPGEIAVLFGEALLAVDAQRRNAGADAPALLRKAWLALARHLLQTNANALTPQQQLFLLSGAAGDLVVVKSQSGERISVRLLDTELYEELLNTVTNVEVAKAPLFFLTPARRMAWLAQHLLEPLDLNKPGRYREPTAKNAGEVDVDALRREMMQARDGLRDAQRELQQATRKLTENLRIERLGPVLMEVATLGKITAQALEHADDPLRLASLPLPVGDHAHATVELVRNLERELSASLGDLTRLPGQLMAELQRMRSYAGAITNAFSGTETGGDFLEETSPLSTVIDPEAIPRITKDWDAVNNSLVQILQNSPNRTPWSASRVMLLEQIEKFNDPLSECCATPANLGAAIRKIDQLHPNCFPHDAAGNPLLPPVIIEPGVGVVRWMDDRFLMSFICTEVARPGKELSLSPVDLAVMQIYGLFLARGDLFNYRGERVYTSFMGEYAGEVESKATVKFTGAEKKMTIVSASSEKDSASREDAVRDYIDFMFFVCNGLQIPKRISPRKITVFLKYCIIGNLERTAMLVLRHVAPTDFQTARELLIKYSERQPRRLIALVEAALRDDVQLAARYRRDTRRALEEVMGREWLQDAINAGHFDAVRPAEIKGQKPVDSAKQDDVPSAPGHDYFDI